MPIATPKPSSTPVAEGPSGPLVPFPRWKEYVDSNRGSEQYSAGPNQQGMPGHTSNQQNREGDHDQEDEDLTQAENAARTGHSMPESAPATIKSSFDHAERTADGFSRNSSEDSQHADGHGKRCVGRTCWVLERWQLRLVAPPIANTESSPVRTGAAKSPRNRTGCRLRSIPPLHSETQAEPDDAHRTVRPPPPPQPGASPVEVGAKDIPVALPGRIEHEDYGSHPERGPAERGVKSVPTYEFPEIDPWQNQQNEDDELFETGEGASGAAHHVRANACPPLCKFLARAYRRRASRSPVRSPLRRLANGSRGRGPENT